MGLEHARSGDEDGGDDGDDNDDDNDDIDCDDDVDNEEDDEEADDAADAASIVTSSSTSRIARATSIRSYTKSCGMSAASSCKNATMNSSASTTRGPLRLKYSFPSTSTTLLRCTACSCRNHARCEAVVRKYFFTSRFVMGSVRPQHAMRRWVGLDAMSADVGSGTDGTCAAPSGCTPPVGCERHVCDHTHSHVVHLRTYACAIRVRVSCI